MSEHGYGWWQAADEKWYPPEQHPSHDPNDSSSYGWWQAADGNSYPPNRHPEYRAAPTMPASVAAPPTMPPPGPPNVPPPPGASPGAPPSGPVGAKAALTPTIIGMLVAAVLIVIGSVLPWATIDLGFISQSTGGLDGDGGITLVLGLVAGALAFLSKGRKTGLAIAAVVAAAISAIIAVIDIADVSSVSGDLGIDSGVSVGIGLWLVLVASLGALGAGIKLVLDCRKS